MPVRGTLVALLASAVIARAAPPVLSGSESIVQAGRASEAPAIARPWIAYPFDNLIDTSILAFDERSNSFVTVLTGEASGRRPAVAGEKVLVDSSVGIFLRDLATNTGTRLSEFGSSPALSTTFAAWVESDGITSRVFIHPLSGGLDSSFTSPNVISDLAASGDRLAYLEWIGSDPAVRRLRVFDRTTGAHVTLAEGALSTPDIDGDRVVVAQALGSAVELRVYDVRGALLAAVRTPGRDPRIDGQWVAFEHDLAGAPRFGLWRWTTGDLFLAPNPKSPSTEPFQRFPDVDGSRVVFTADRDTSDDGGDVWAFDFGVTATSAAFRDTFDACADNTTPAGWQVPAGWYCRSGRLRGEGARAIAIARTPGFQDSDVQARVQLNSNDGSGVVARAQGSSYYAARLRSSQVVEFVRVNGGVVQVLATRSAAISQNVSYTLRLRATGQNPVRLVVDLSGATIASVDDASPARLYGGFTGLLHGGSFRSQFDEFTSSGSAPAFVVEPPPTSGGTPPGAQVSVNETFQNCPDFSALPAPFTTTGNWYCKSGRARGEGALSLAIANTAPLEATTVNAYVQLNSSDGSGVVGRASGSSYYAARLRSSGRLQLVRVNGGVETVLADAPQPVAQATSYFVSLTAHGTNPVQLTASSDEVTISFTDTSTSRLVAGRAGLLHGGGFRTQAFNFSLFGNAAGSTPPAPGPVSFADDFDACTSTTNLGANWETSGRWYCQSQRARGESALGLALARTATMGDTDVSALVQLNSSDGSGVIARAADGRFYAARLLVSGRLQIVRVEGAAITVLADVARTVALNTSYTLRLVVSGTTSVQLNLAVNGVAALAATDTSSRRVASGRAGLLSGANGRTQFDNFFVRGTAP